MAVDAMAILASALVALGLHGPTASNLDKKEVICLADNVYWEARGESRLGKRAVAYTTLHRVAKPGWPDSVCDVVWQKGKSGKMYVAQFSWTLDGKSDRVSKEHEETWEECLEVALRVMLKKVPDPTTDIGGATHFYAHNKVSPAWAVNAKLRKVIGNHTFVRLN